jgi:glycosyltransferase involved in cell wall biosynthesis
LAVVSLVKKRVLKLIDSDPVDVIHAHSPSIIGVAAWTAATSRHLPFVYEVRGFWEDSAVDQNRISRRSLRYHLSRRLEEFVARHADYVISISQSILQDLQARGIAPNKMMVIPNGVDADGFTPLPRDAQLAASLGLPRDLPVLGYIGSLWRFEGIPWLVRAVAELRRRGIQTSLLVIGHGEETAAVRTAIKACAAEDFILFLGQKPHDEIARYYSLLDVLVYPRRRARVTEKVTPLKPLEASAQAKAILGSDVGGIRELVKAEETGLLFDPDNIEDFCRQATRLLLDAELRRRLGKSGRELILRERDWKLLGRSYETVYDKIARHHDV